MTAAARSQAQTCAEIDAATFRLADMDPVGQVYLDLYAWRDDLYGELYAAHAEMSGPRQI